MPRRLAPLALSLTAITVALVVPGAPGSANDLSARQSAPRFAECGRGKRVTCVVDGDTFWLNGTKIRIADIDTPEVFSPKCPAERTLGEAATRRLTALLNEGPFDLTGDGEDRYGRALRVVERGGVSVSAALVHEGLAEEWGGRRRGWCNTIIGDAKN